VLKQQGCHGAQERKFTRLERTLFDVEVAQNRNSGPTLRTESHPEVRHDWRAEGEEPMVDPAVVTHEFAVLGRQAAQGL